MILVFKDAYMSFNMAHNHKLISSLGVEPDSKVYFNTRGQTDPAGMMKIGYVSPPKGILRVFLIIWDFHHMW